ncbi:type IV secretory system conjugative DNA transfer family protein [Mesorhizobium sp. M8A.F.Ca.ET.165.01.1.1]|uniref:type IV secretory system conjugative DNA transfer family protein n=1 Tax=Mesorhizobium sp. M8A.F.Ca.ET.165.01.1.1 TaxID=2563960 RepID=UPI00167AE65A|nr:type IV secretory system conjugative DNA transfer family protein [Mesorhizobium sp. M8A.F.Ca.ET.165.01.1.1]
MGVTLGLAKRLKIRLEQGHNTTAMNLLKVLFWPFWVIILVLTRLSDELVRGTWHLIFRRKAEPLNIHGDAKWADYAMLTKAMAFKRGGLLYGLFSKKGVAVDKLLRLYAHPESSVIGIAAKGMGKTQSTIAMLRDQVTGADKPDILCLDPAGDVSAVTVDLMRANGYDVKVADFRNADSSDPLDVCSILDPSDPMFDQTLMGFCEGAVEDDSGGRDEHWTESSRGLVYAILFGFMKVDGERTPMFKMAQALTDAKERTKVFKRFAHLYNPTLRAGLNAFLEASDKERGSFTTTVTRKVRVWLLDGVRRITSEHSVARSWTFRELWTADKPSAVFIIVGLRSDRNSEGAVARVAITNAVMTRQKMWDEGKRRDRNFKFRRRMVAAIDEGLMLGNCRAIVDANVQLRKAGWLQWLMYPSLEDVRELFGRAAAASLMGGCIRFVFGGSGELGTYREFSEQLGKTTIDNPNYNESDRGASTGGSAASRNLANPDELRGMPDTMGAAIVRDLNVQFYKPYGFRNGEPYYP